jgi:hypothetical protein
MPDGQTDPAAIVEALAQLPPPLDLETDVCVLCGTDEDFSHGWYDPATGRGRYEGPGGHAPACPWRRACEWALRRDALRRAVTLRPPSRFR